LIKRFIKWSLRRLGLELRYYRPDSSDEARFMAGLSAHGVNLVLDVGANAGQFGRLIRAAGYRGRIVSFEPLSTARKLLEAEVRGDPLWQMAPQMAIGDKDGEIEVHIAGNSYSSSVLPMLNAHSSTAPESAYIGTEKAPLRRLDAVASGYLSPDAVLFLKIDTQGYEDRVLEGAPDLLRRAVGLQVEMSMVPLYEGQRLYVEMDARLRALGFELWGLAPAFVDARNGRTLQMDATYFRA
jgi:FkbM family methyltransferase